MFIIRSPMTHIAHYLLAAHNEHVGFSQDQLYVYPSGRVGQHL